MMFNYEIPKCFDEALQEIILADAVEQQKWAPEVLEDHGITCTDEWDRISYENVRFLQYDEDDKHYLTITATVIFYLDGEEFMNWEWNECSWIPHACSIEIVPNENLNTLGKRIFEIALEKVRDPMHRQY